jgi:hypothetical protein
MPSVSIDHPQCKVASDENCKKCILICNQASDDVHNLLYGNQELIDKLHEAIREGKHFQFTLVKPTPKSGGIKDG